MARPIYAQRWHSLDAPLIRKSPEDGGIYAISTIAPAKLLVIAQAPNLRQALFDALPPLGPNVRVSRHLEESVTICIPPAALFQTPRNEKSWQGN